MSHARRRRLAVALAATALVGAACTSPSTDGTQTTDGAADARGAGASEQPLTALTGGDPLPAAELQELAVGDDAPVVDTTSWLGTPTVVNFWATWCGFCVEEMPDFQAVHEQLGDDVRFVGVDREDREADAVDFVAAAGVTYDLVEDPAADFFFATRARAMPTTLFVDADGVIRHRYAGPLDADELRALIAEHLDVDVR